jgi:hypothetical protein
MFIKKRGQSFQEYAILLALAAAAFIAMQAYMKRGMQGRLRDLANQISPKQYEANDTTSKTVIDREGSSTEKETPGKYEITSSDSTTTTYESTVVEQ